MVLNVRGIIRHAHELEASAIPFTHRVATGVPADMISQLACELQSNAIIMGMRGLSR
jgi:nucleotide-binding universal stress UspA family protein